MSSSRRARAFALALSLLLSPSVRAGGAVASACPLASEAGEAILAEGGSAADAAVATALALAVTFPQAGNLGGGGFAIVRNEGDVAALDFRETAPAAATATMYLDARGEPIPGASLVGPLAAGVPGSPQGLFELHRRYGRLPWARVVEPAIRLADDGFAVNARLARALATDRDLLARFAETRAIWLRGDATLAEGQRVRQPHLARTLRAYSRRGPDAIARGRIAREIERVATRHGGVLRARDLAAYEPAWREPVRLRFAGWEIASMPLPSSGGTILGMTLGALDRLDRPDASAVDRTHLLVESWRRAYAARFLMGDPSTTRATSAHLLDGAFLDAQAALVDRARATPSSGVAPPRLDREPAETTHVSVIDDAGNAVALTTTLNASFGCGLVAGRAGFLLNNEMDDFATAPGRPNLYGLVQGEANAVGPGKRMLSSMTPTVAWRDGEVIALGSPGGSRIPTTVTQVLLAVLVDGASLEDAVARPRLHHQWLPDELRFEPGALDDAERAELARRGHAIAETDRIGEVHAVRRFADGRREVADDPRSTPTLVAAPAPGL